MTVTVEITERSGATRVVSLDRDEITIGRTPDNDVVLPTGKIGRRHSRVVVRDGKLIVVDLKSTNGTFVDGKRLHAPQVLKPGAKVVVGDCTLTFRLGAPEEITLPPLSPTPPPAPPLPAFVPLPEDAMHVTAPVVRVTAYEDRAQVTRETVVSLAPGACTLVIDDVTALVSEAHTQVRLLPEGGAGDATVDDVRVHRTQVTDDLPSAERQRELATKRQALLSTLEEEKANLSRLERDVTRTRSMFVTFCHVGSRRLVEASPDLTVATAARALSARAQALLDELDAARRRASKVTEDVKAIDTLVARDQRRPVRPRADLVARVSGPGGTFRLIASTIVPCGLWRPSHEAHLGADDRVRFVTYATVWQKTGEAWNDVELTLSTARPSKGATMPALRPDVLTTREKTPEERKTITVEHREEVVPRADTTGTAPGVDDGGEVRTYTASSRVSIPSDGRPHKVAVASFEAPAKRERIAVPEVSRHVVLRATLENRGDRPILAGPVTLVEGGQYIGTGDVLFCGAGETFDLSFGSDDRYRVRFRTERVVEEKLIVKDRTIFVCKAWVRSTSSASEKVTVLLRMPVSEVENVEVIPSMPHCSEGVPRPDAHGLVRIPLVLPPAGEKEISLGFTFKTSGDVRIPDPW